MYFISSSLLAPLISKSCEKSATCKNNCMPVLEWLWPQKNMYTSMLHLVAATFFSVVVRANSTLGSFWAVLGHLTLRFAPYLLSVPTAGCSSSCFQGYLLSCFSPRPLELVGRKELTKAKASPFLQGVGPVLSFPCSHWILRPPLPLSFSSLTWMQRKKYTLSVTAPVVGPDRLSGLKFKLNP